ncbi:MAG: FAD-dependent oxidoreductase, partial [Mycoplasmataceae bacterium]|nr:FAD-dependent oxidoreductase [Mycoplasmataceae bacterium]
MKIIVIGGGAGGAGAAARCRRLSEESDITIFERSGYASYSNCGLPYKFSDEIEKFDNLIMTTPEALLKQYKLKVRVNHEVLSIDAENKVLTVKQT